MKYSGLERKKKILMLIPNLGFGGAQRVFAEQAKLLAEKFEVVECTFNLEDKQVYLSGNRLTSLDVPAGKSTFYKILFFLKRCWRFYKLKQREKPDITISHLEGADYVNILSFGRERKIFVVHGSKKFDEEMNNSYGILRKRILLPLLYKFAKQVITVSEGIRNELIQSYGLVPEKIITIYNFFSLKELEKRAAEVVAFLPKEEGTFRLITSGRFANQKNHRSLLYMLKILKEEYGSFMVELFIIGDGPLKQELLKECEHLNLVVEEITESSGLKRADVYFLGYQNNPFKYYKYMDIFLLPSVWEGFPMALGEAMALGLPVLASDCPTGPLEFLEPDWEKEIERQRKYPKFTSYGVLLPIPKVENSKTIRCWVDVIVALLQDEHKRNLFAKQAVERMQQFDKQRIAKRWLEIDKE